MRRGEWIILSGQMLLGLSAGLMLAAVVVCAAQSFVPAVTELIAAAAGAAIIGGAVELLGEWMDYEC
ncbi:hypothetical protein HW273_05435 [Oribacterium sp. oral taxon 102]|uniref:hypothetical protein n=1 Tax=Oribacterium sp. oral taxon 102 TaxID=671214 RepID=UPI0015BC0001|nr:hypothetical protein [Oribacterium sp. oral taxon 102]NWO21338.1 hypothetical protein [Oribacterium sp. oral taxon 102]